MGGERALEGERMKAIYRDIYLDLKAEITRGTYPYQSFLPSESELVQHYGCSHNTVRRALAMLADEGCVQPIHGKGVRVISKISDDRAQFSFGSIESYSEAVKTAGIESTTAVRLFETVRANEYLANVTGFPLGEELWHIERVRTVNGKRLIRDLNYFSVEQVPNLTEEIASGSIYSYLEDELGFVVAVSNRVLTVERATPEDFEALDMEDYHSLAVVSGQMFTQDGLHVESTQSRHRQDYFAFRYTSRRNK